MLIYKNKKILITGGTGFIGSRLAERLVIEEKAEVTILVNSWSKAIWVSRLNVKLVQGNILDKAILDKITHDIDIVFHCVGIGGTLEQSMLTNVQGTKLVLESCLQNKVKRIVYLSSAVVTGPIINDMLNERAPYLKTGNPYADSKIEAEKLFLNFVKNNEIEGSVIRPTFVWGPISPYYTIDVIQQMKAKKFRMVDHGKGACNAVYIDNLIDLALICGHHIKAINEVFLVRDLEKKSWNEFYSYYSNMLSINVNSFESIPSISNIKRKIALKIKKRLNKVRQKLTNKVVKFNEVKPIKAKYIFKAPRKIVKIFIKPLERNFPEIDDWDLKSYSSLGFIDISKAEKIVGYKPRFSIKEGMVACEKSLKLQNYI